MKKSQVTEDSIKELVDGFYNKIRQDKDLGPIFGNVIGNGPEAWKPHLNTMYDFWSSMLLGSGRYNGRPMPKHMVLPPFDTALFDRWLALFSETAHEIHTDDIAAIFVERSRRIAENLKFGVSRAWGQR
jgi:hemoglobin